MRRQRITSAKQYVYPGSYVEGVLKAKTLQRLVAASDETEAYTTFTGVTRLKQGISPSGVRIDDQPSGNLSRAVTVAVTSRKYHVSILVH